MKITVIGAGNMGGAIAEGAVRKGVVAPQDLTIADPRAEFAEKLQKEGLNVVYTTDNVASLAGADLVVVAVKPWLTQEVLSAISSSIDRTRQVLVSIPAGIPFAQLDQWLEVDTRGSVAICRVIPNTAIALARSMTFIASHNIAAERKEPVLALFRELGDVMEVEEGEITAYTALSSSGIAYAFKYMEASAKGGADMGIEPGKALDVVIKTVEGAVALMQARGQAPSVEIRRVATPGGLTEKGLAAMDDEGFTEAVIRGLWATR